MKALQGSVILVRSPSSIVPRLQFRSLKVRLPCREEREVSETIIVVIFSVVGAGRAEWFRMPRSSWQSPADEQ